jgi:hypothetical protein
MHEMVCGSHNDLIVHNIRRQQMGPRIRGKNLVIYIMMCKEIMEKVWNTCGVTIKLKRSHEFIALKQWVKLGSNVFFNVNLKLPSTIVLKKLEGYFCIIAKRLQNKTWIVLKFSTKT